MASLDRNSGPPPSYVFDSNAAWSVPTLYSLANPYEEGAALWALMMNYPQLVRRKMRSSTAWRDQVENLASAFLRDGTFTARFPWELSILKRRPGPFVFAFLYTLAAALFFVPAPYLQAAFSAGLVVAKLTAFLFIWQKIPSVTLRVSLSSISRRLSEGIKRRIRGTAAGLVSALFEFQRLAIVAAVIAFALLLTDASKFLDVLRPRPIPIQSMIRDTAAAINEFRRSPLSAFREAGRSVATDIHDAISTDATGAWHKAPMPLAKRHDLENAIPLYEPLIAPNLKNKLARLPDLGILHYVLQPSDYFVEFFEWTRNQDGQEGFKEWPAEPIVTNGNILLTKPWEKQIPKRTEDQGLYSRLIFDLPQGVNFSQLESMDLQIGNAGFITLKRPFFGSAPTTATAYVSAELRSATSMETRPYPISIGSNLTQHIVLDNSEKRLQRFTRVAFLISPVGSELSRFQGYYLFLADPRGIKLRINLKQKPKEAIPHYRRYRDKSIPTKGNLPDFGSVIEPESRSPIHSQRNNALRAAA